MDIILIRPAVIHSFTLALSVLECLQALLVLDLRGALCHLDSFWFVL